EIEEEDLPLVEDPVKAHQLALEDEANLPAIHRYWLPLRKPAVETVRNEAPKVGRNDDCPCGSGKKFKQCHGKLAKGLPRRTEKASRGTPFLLCVSA
ncbi:SEC-C metal-binding domain-containing protein, partial [Achromobacter sp. GbtcB20]|uniref:SEC-C metal-binding domain-containing protein n=1 Tax=Achromobacter sp. GbtcB20 TaxID=2824765 RepID=UPI001C2F5EE8